MKVGLFGGSFDPLHKGHLALAQAACLELKLRRLYFVLSPQSPLKEKPLTPFAHRLNMLRLAIKGKKPFLAATWELKRRGPSYTIQTLRDYKKQRSTDELYWIMGSDCLKEFHRWKDPEKILKFARLVIGRRPGAMKSFGPEIINFDINRMTFLKGVFPTVSSTLIRRSIRRKGKTSHWIPPSVLHYILKNGLYGC